MLFKKTNHRIKYLLSAILLILLTGGFLFWSYIQSDPPFPPSHRRILLSKDSFVYRFRDKKLPFTVWLPDQKDSLTITIMDITGCPPLFPSCYSIHVFGTLKDSLQHNAGTFDMEETSEWPEATFDAVPWNY